MGEPQGRLGGVTLRFGELLVSRDEREAPSERGGHQRTHTRPLWAVTGLDALWLRTRAARQATSAVWLWQVTYYFLKDIIYLLER